MAMLDKLKFWEKKHEEPIPDFPESQDPIGDQFSMDEPMGLDHTTPGYKEKPLAPLGAQPSVSPQYGGMNRDTELILAKLDAIKARVESIDARVAHIEKIAEQEQ